MNQPRYWLRAEAITQINEYPVIMHHQNYKLSFQSEITMLH